MATQTIGDQDTDKTFRELTSKEHLAKTGHNAKDQKPLREQEEKAAGQSGANTQDQPNHSASETSPQNLSQAESSPGNNSGLYVGSKMKARSGRRKKGVAAVIVAMILGTGITGTVILSGPFKILHFAQLLGNHSQSEEQDGDSRLTKIARWMGNPGKPENVRLGVLANTYATAIEARFNAVGFTPTFTDAFGYLNNFEVDKTKLSGQFKDLRNASDEDIAKHFQERYGAAVQRTPDGKLIVSTKGMSYSDLRLLTADTMKSAGYSRVVAQIGSRISIKRYGATSLLHPLRKLDDAWKRTLDRGFTKWREAHTKAINGGDSELRISSSGIVSEEEGSAATAEEAEKELEKAIKDTSEASKNSSPTAAESTASSLKTKLAIGGGATVGVLSYMCLAKHFADSYDSTKMAMVQAKLVRRFVEIRAVGQQIANMAFTDISDWQQYWDQMGWVANELEDMVNKTSAFDARGIQHNNFQEVTGPADPDSVRLGDNALAKALDSIPGLEGFCTVTESPAVAYPLLVVGIVTAPVLTIVQAAALHVADDHMADIVGWLGGDAIQDNPVGWLTGVYDDYGAFFAALDVGASTGGMPLTRTQAAELWQTNIALNKDEFQSKSIAYRLFNPRDYRSLISRVIDKQDTTSPGSAIASLANNILAIARAPMQTISSALSSRVFAAAEVTPYDYGIPQIGTPLEDLNNPLVENPFDNANKALRIIAGPDGQKYIDRAKTCNGMVVGTDGSIHSDSQPPTIKNMTDPDNGCADRSTEWLRVRFYIKDTVTMESIACYNNDAEACNNVGFSNGATNDDSDAPATNNAGGTDSNTDGANDTTGNTDDNTGDGDSNGGTDSGSVSGTIIPTLFLQILRGLL